MAAGQDLQADAPGEATPVLPAWRCRGCGAKLAEIAPGPGTVARIRCHHCKCLNTLNTPGLTALSAA